VRSVTYEAGCPWRERRHILGNQILVLCGRFKNPCNLDRCRTRKMWAWHRRGVVELTIAIFTSGIQTRMLRPMTAPHTMRHEEAADGSRDTLGIALSCACCQSRYSLPLIREINAINLEFRLQSRNSLITSPPVFSVESCQSDRWSRDELVAKTTTPEGGFNNFVELKSDFDDHPSVVDASFITKHISCPAQPVAYGRRFGIQRVMRWFFFDKIGPWDHAEKCRFWLVAERM
jgi:hypothetical protein